MKNHLLLSILLIFITMQSFAQDVNLYVIKENIETVVANNQRIVSDPFIMDNYMDFPGIGETFKLLDTEDDIEEKASEDTPGRLGNFNLKMETVLSPTSKFLQG